MLGLFTRLFDGDASPAAKGDLSRAVRQGLDLKAAIAAHRDWRIRIENVLAGRSTEALRPEELCFDDRCALGRWIHGPARAELGHLPDYHKLVADHRKFHHAASNVVALAQAGKVGEAMRIFEGPYDAASTGSSPRSSRSARCSTRKPPLNTGRATSRTSSVSSSVSSPI